VSDFDLASLLFWLGGGLVVSYSAFHIPLSYLTTLHHGIQTSEALIV
jgi:hypothetical protein